VTLPFQISTIGNFEGVLSESIETIKVIFALFSNRYRDVVQLLECIHHWLAATIVNFHPNLYYAEVII
jgi:hypothetical protein